MDKKIDQLLNAERVNSEIYEFGYQWLKSFGITSQFAHIINTVALLGVVVILLFVLNIIIRNIFVVLFAKLVGKTSTKWDDYLIENKFFSRLSMLLLLMVTDDFLPLVFYGFPKLLGFLDTAFVLINTLFALRVVSALLRTGRDILKTRKDFVDKPLDSYFQVLQIFLWFIGGSIVFTVLTGKSPSDFLISMGAASAILMLVFKDTILGFVASIQVSANDSVRVGDWIEMKKFNVDGDVMQINLNNIRVRNFDRTEVTVPTHLLLTESFINYRAMQQSGGRRIKRSLKIKISSIRYIAESEISSFEQIQHLQSYLGERTTEIAEFNKENNLIDTVLPLNGRRLTNVGLFRAYITAYAKNHRFINKNSLIMTRQLESNEHGLPLELYMFTDGTNWEFYEGVMSDIFDHLFAAVKYFDLEIFEAPSSSDFKGLSNMLHDGGKAPSENKQSPSA